MRIGDTTAVLDTEDGGRTWQRAVLPATIRNISQPRCPDPRDCLVIGTSSSASSRGVLLTSHDGGAFWTTVPGTPPALIATAHGLPSGVPGVFCGSATDCLLQTSSLAVFRTTDGGLTWHRATLPRSRPATEIQFGQVACPTTTTCVATASIFDDGHGGDGLGTPAILVSHDGGTTWRLHAVPPPRALPDQ